MMSLVNRLKEDGIELLLVFFSKISTSVTDMF